MRKGIIISTILLGGLLAACGNQNTNKQSSSTSSSTSHVSATSKSGSHTQVAKSSTSSKADKTANLWSQTKTQKLSSFMVTWGKTMQQTYDRYEPGNNTNFYGLKYPLELKKGNIMVNNQSASLAWSSTGQGTADYEVVGIYSDSKNAGMNAHLYLFTIHDGGPVVLVTQQNQGNEENKVYFKTTDNNNLKNGFSKIVSGQATSSAESQTTTSKQSQQQTPQPYDISSSWQGTWYSVDDQNKMYKITFTDHTMSSSSDDTKSFTAKWYLTDESDLDDKSNIHNDWARVFKQPTEKNGISFVHVRGWNQTAGAGDYFGTTSENVDGTPTTVMVSAGGAGIWCDSVYYRTAAMAKQQTTTRFDDIDYGNE